MTNKQGNNIRLGIFMLTGFIALMAAFYMVGANHSMFGADFQIKTRFSGLNGLAEGDNVLFSGLQAGTVKKIQMINDSTIEATMAIDDRIRRFINKNAITAIGSDGLIGNKVVNIFQGKGDSAKIQNGDLLKSKKPLDIDAMLLTFSKTNLNAEVISEDLKKSIEKVNESELFELLGDKELSAAIKYSLRNIKATTENSEMLTENMKSIISDTKHGKGVAGLLFEDTLFAAKLKTTISHINNVSNHADHISGQLDYIVTNLKNDLYKGNGPAAVLLRDSVMAKNLQATVENIKNGTDGFNQNMNALKENFFFKGYFKRQTKKRIEDAQKKASNNQ